MINQLSDVLSELRNRTQTVPKPPTLPTTEQVDLIEDALGASLPPDLRNYLLNASDVVFGALEPATAVNPTWQTYLLNIVDTGRAYGVPDELLPFCEDNGDFYCFDMNERIVFLEPQWCR